jgi:HD-GYP domain-containing protein (c-di-GMP phosphodiesterase class II)
VDKFPSLVTLLDESIHPCNSSEVKFAVRQLAAQEKARRLFVRLFEKDPYTFYHSLRVAELVNALGTELKLSTEELIDATLSALFHDIGKIFTPDSVLKKPGPLVPDEFVLMKMHPVDSQKLVESVNSLKHLGTIIRCHHERWDGRGYPDGVKGTEIPWLARLILVADTFDAMTSTRIYRTHKSHEEAYAEIERCSGSQFDPGIAPIFIQAHKKLTESSVLREKLAA